MTKPIRIRQYWPTFRHEGAAPLYEIHINGNLYVDNEGFCGFKIDHAWQIIARLRHVD